MGESNHEPVTDAELAEVERLYSLFLGLDQNKSAAAEEAIKALSLDWLYRMAAELRALRAQEAAIHQALDDAGFDALGDLADRVGYAINARDNARDDLAALRASVDVDVEVEQMARETWGLVTCRPADKAAWYALKEEKRFLWRAAVRPHVEHAARLQREAEGLRAEIAEAHATLTEQGTTATSLPLVRRIVDLIDAVDATHDDEEAAHQETLEMLATARAEIERMRLQIHEDREVHRRAQEQKDAEIERLTKELAETEAARAE